MIRRTRSAPLRRTGLLAGLGLWVALLGAVGRPAASAAESPLAAATHGRLREAVVTVLGAPAPAIAGWGADLGRFPVDLAWLKPESAPRFRAFVAAVADYKQILGEPFDEADARFRATLPTAAPATGAEPDPVFRSFEYGTYLAGLIARADAAACLYEVMLTSGEGTPAELKQVYDYGMGAARLVHAATPAALADRRTLDLRDAIVGRLAKLAETPAPGYPLAGRPQPVPAPAPVPNPPNTSPGTPGPGTPVQPVPAPAPVEPPKPEPLLDGPIVVSRAGDGQFATIMAAVRRAKPGAEIRIRPGTYTEPIVLDRKLTLVGEGPLDRVVVEAETGSTVTMRTDEATVRGLTLRCKALDESERVAAVEVPRGRLIVEDCDLTSDSIASVMVYGAEANPILRRCKIRDGNVGVYVYSNGQGTFRDCEISGSKYPGVILTVGGNPVFQGCKIRGGGVFCFHGGLGVFDDCEITGTPKAAVETHSGGNPAFHNCRITKNQGLGIWAHDGGAGTFDLCDLSGNAKGPASIAAECPVRITNSKS